MRIADAAAAVPSVAIVDAPAELAEQLETVLQAAGLQTKRVDLAGFVDGESAVATLLSQGVDAVVYVLGSNYQPNRIRFSQLYEAIANHGTPFLITARLRGGGQAQGDESNSAPNSEMSSEIEWLVRRIQREIASHHYSGS